MCEEDIVGPDKEWAEIARRSGKRWATENPYDTETGNEAESTTIT
jgi:hypothetical protein